MTLSSQPASYRPKVRLLLTLGLIVLGLAISGYFGVRTLRSFREISYIRQQGFDRGTASIDAMRGWMTIRFVAVAYAVPEEYLYSQLGIALDQRNANRTLGDLNRERQLGISPNGNYPAIIDQAKAAITAYRADPVTTGLRDVRPWMSVQYIANSSGVPAEYIFTRLRLPQEGNAYMPLEMLSEQQRYPGGPRALARAVQRALAAHQGQP